MEIKNFLEKYKTPLLKYCFEVLKHKISNTYFNTGKFLIPNFYVDGVFVSFYKYTDLRHCLGNSKGVSTSPINLKDELSNLIMSQDTIYMNKLIKSISNVKCEVSILYRFKEINHHLDWNIGKHGIVLRYTKKENISTLNIHPTLEEEKTAIFLPSVALDKKWTHEETLLQLYRKAGILIDELNDDILRNTKFKIFEVYIISGVYEDFSSIPTSGLFIRLLTKTARDYFSRPEYLLYKDLKTKILNNQEKIKIIKNSSLVYVLNISKNFEKIKNFIIAEFYNYYSEKLDFIFSDGYLYIMKKKIISTQQEMDYITNDYIKDTMKSSFVLLLEHCAKKGLILKNDDSKIRYLYFFVKNDSGEIEKVYKNLILDNEKIIDFSNKELIRNATYLDFFYDDVDVFIDKEGTGPSHFMSFIDQESSNFIYSRGFHKELNKLYGWKFPPIGIINSIFSVSDMEIIVKFLSFNTFQMYDDGVIGIPLTRKYELIISLPESRTRVHKSLIKVIMIPMVRFDDFFIGYDGIFKRKQKVSETDTAIYKFNPNVLILNEMGILFSIRDILSKKILHSKRIEKLEQLILGNTLRK